MLMGLLVELLIGMAGFFFTIIFYLELEERKIFKTSFARKTIAITFTVCIIFLYVNFLNNLQTFEWVNRFKPFALDFFRNLLPFLFES